MKTLTLSALKQTLGRSKALPRSGDIIVTTSEGDPAFLLVRIGPKTVAETLRALRRIRGMEALNRLQSTAKSAKGARISAKEIQSEIRVARAKRRTRLGR